MLPRTCSCHLIAHDTVHTVTNAATALFMPFDGYVENICSDMFYEIEKSPKAKELIGEIQILIKVVSSNKNARGTLPVSFSIKMFDTQHETTICQEGEWTVKAELRTRKKFLAVGEACMAIF